MHKATCNAEIPIKYPVYRKLILTVHTRTIDGHCLASNENDKTIAAYVADLIE